ncbi:TetR/AcrR family transcriptional regulator [Gordonia humi]|uniref:TetR/AcrR family transcriptional regulator n=1 Tax=Gordonia humi TaxID=686429 RepID=UPI0036232793
MTRPGEPLEVLLNRAVRAAPTVEVPVGDAAVFDAAMRVITEHGVRAVTMDHVAAESGVSRATLFRRFESKDHLLQGALTYEVTRFLDEMGRALNDLPTVSERVTEALMTCLRMSSHPLFSDGSDESNRTGLLRAITIGDPSPLELGHAFVAGRIAAAQASGELPPGDSDLQADVLIRVVLGYTLVPQSTIDITDDETLRAIAVSALVPILYPRSQ